MYRIAIIEDMENDAERLKCFAQEYMKEHGIAFTFKHFSNALDFFDTDTHADILFLDMEMPVMKGVEAAQRIRKYDEEMIIIFYSGAKQYALDGYSVDALDFLLKPVSKYDVYKKLDRALGALRKKCLAHITLHDIDGNIAKVNISDIRYIEKERNYIIFSVRDKIYRERKNLYEIEQLFTKYGFAKCRSGVMVNLRFIDKYNKESVFVDDKEFLVSRGEHDAFFTKLLDYFK